MRNLGRAQRDGRDRGRSGELLLALASPVLLGSESRGTPGHILQSRDSRSRATRFNEGQSNRRMADLYGRSHQIHGAKTISAMGSFPFNTGSAVDSSHCINNIIPGKLNNSLL
jgi:hypothetical protein